MDMKQWGGYVQIWLLTAIGIGALLTVGCAALLTDQEKRNIVEEGQAAADSHYWEAKWKMCDVQTTGALSRILANDPTEYAKWEAFCR